MLVRVGAVKQKRLDWSVRGVAFIHRADERYIVVVVIELFGIRSGRNPIIADGNRRWDLTDRGFVFHFSTFIPSPPPRLICLYLRSSAFICG